MSERCKERVLDGYHHRNCARNAVKDGYCKQHHPDAAAERQKQSEKRYALELVRSPQNLLRQANMEIVRLRNEANRPTNRHLLDAEIARLNEEASASAQIERDYNRFAPMQAEIDRLRTCVEARDKAASAGRGTLYYCQYCGARGSTHPFGAQPHSSHCPTLTHPLEVML